MLQPEFHYIGQHLPRKEDYRLLTGQGRYVDDIEIPGAVHACFVRSPHAHARIVSINADAARQMPGVIAVVTGHDLARWTTRQRMAPPIDGRVRWTWIPCPSTKSASRVIRWPA